MNHKFWNAGAGKPEGVTHAVKNAEAVTIPAGTPVVYAMNGTDDGLAVILPSSAGSTKMQTFVAGVTVKDILPGRLGEIQVYGFNRKSLIFRGTRAASTDSWPTFAAAANAITLGINTAMNAFDPGGASQVDPFVILGEQLSATPTLPSSNIGAGSAGATNYYQAAKTFLRFM